MEATKAPTPRATDASASSRPQCSIQCLGWSTEAEGQDASNSQARWRVQEQVEGARDQGDAEETEGEAELKAFERVPQFTSVFQWQQWLSTCNFDKVSRLSLGIQLYFTVLSFPAQFGLIARWFANAMPFQGGRGKGTSCLCRFLR